MLFLIEYDRKRGKIVTLQTFSDAEEASAQFARLEKELDLNRAAIEHEVVILEANDEKALRRTHRRYFESLEELAKAS